MEIHIRIRKLRKRKWQGIVALFVVSCCLGTVFFGILFYERKQNAAYRAELSRLELELQGIQKTVYVAAKDLQRGELATREKLKEEQYRSSQPADWFMTEEELGKEMRVAVKAGTPLLLGMFAEEEQGKQREVFLSAVRIGGFMEAGDRVDVRIAYQNGEDYVVLSDKELLLCEASGIVLLLGDREIEMLSSAMTDEKQYRDTKLYAVRYPRDKQTEKSAVTYLPNEAVAGLLGQKQELINDRRQLEERLRRTEEAW